MNNKRTCILLCHEYRTKSYRIVLNEHIGSLNHCTTFSIPVPPDLELTCNSTINIELWHSEMGKIRYDDFFSGSEIMKFPYSVDLLTEALKLFTAHDTFVDYLLNPGDDKKQVTGVSWLLGSMGFRTNDLGRITNKHETVKGSNHQVSCDFLVSHGSDMVLAMDCTITVPRHDKVIKTYNTATALADALEEKLKTDVQIIPAIISSANCGGLDTTKDRVILLDRNELFYLLDCITEGLQDDAMVFLNKKITRSIH